jgi:hypothetical protein
MKNCHFVRALSVALGLWAAGAAVACSGDDNNSNPAPTLSDSGANGADATTGSDAGPGEGQDASLGDSSIAADAPSLDTGSCKSDASTCNACYSPAQAAADPYNACSPYAKACIPFDPTRVPSHPAL